MSNLFSDTSYFDMEFSSCCIPDSMSINLAFEIVNLPWNSDLDDPSSALFKAYSTKFCQDVSLKSLFLHIVLSISKMENAKVTIIRYSLYLFFRKLRNLIHLVKIFR